MQVDDPETAETASVDFVTAAACSRNRWAWSIVDVVLGRTSSASFASNSHACVVRPQLLVSLHGMSLCTCQPF